MAAKRHYASKKMSNEEVGVESNYMSQRRRNDGTAGMISNDYNAMANLPTEVVMRPYPKPYGYLPEDLGNEYTAADRQIAEDSRQMRKSLAPKKY